MNDGDQIDAARNGDPRAISDLLMRHRGIVAAVVARFIDGAEPRRDVVQNVFMKAVRAIAGFNGHCRFSTWLYRIAVNECVDARRKAVRSRAQQVPASHGPDLFRDLNAPDGLQHTSDSELRRDIQAAVGALPLDRKTAFSLFYFGGYSGREASNAMRITEGNFFMKLKQARDAVREALMKAGWGK
jgi:RNA polymerase sigma-70 factor (ECF subfamily)